MKNKKIIPVFFATDDNYVGLLTVALKSMLNNASKKYFYNIHILTSNLSKESVDNLNLFNSENSKIFFENVAEKIASVNKNLHTRDYYSKATYYRFFIPELFPGYDKILYLDCDIAVIGDISKLYNYNLKNNLVGAIQDNILLKEPFSTYSNKVLGIDCKKYFNAGILVMNLKQMRIDHIEKKFFDLLSTYTFSVTQDQDYLNVLCRDKVLFIPEGWNKMPDRNNPIDENELYLIHYKIDARPWLFDNVLYANHFWKYAKQTPYYKQLDALKTENYKKEKEIREKIGFERLVELAKSEIANPIYKKSVIEQLDNEQKDNNGKSADRIKILKRIAQYEKMEWFDIDAEEDPPTKVLMPNKVDYLNKKIINKVKTKIANKIATNFFEKLIKNKQLIIENTVGLENFDKVEGGAILTCNHFNPFDNYALYKAIKKSMGKKRLYKVIREGNFTSFSGIFGFFFKHCNTLPLSSNSSTMKRFLRAISTLLKRGEKILIYPEQAMWWNYKKPRPFKTGAFNLAVRNNVPIVPCFITMKDSDVLDSNGFYVQKYTIHIFEPIYPNKNLSKQENITEMLNKNFELWKNCYEKEYGIKLSY